MSPEFGVAEEYVRAVNEQDADAFAAIFAEDAVVDDAGRTFRGREAIAAWGLSDIFTPRVTLEVLRRAKFGDEDVLTTKVDGNFDRTGLPDPVVIEQRVATIDGKIARLTCRLASLPDQHGLAEVLWRAD